MSSRISLSLLVAAAIFAAQAPVHAYIDPGSTSLFLQAIVGGVAALLVVTRSYWSRLRQFGASRLGLLAPSRRSRFAAKADRKTGDRSEPE